MARPLAVSVLALLMVACVGTREPEPCNDEPVLRLGVGAERPELMVEIADSHAERQRGLMGRASLGADRGMVFLFDGPTDGGFWMKDTLIPLSIAFWAEDRRIVAILDMQPCREEPCEIYRPGVNYLGAVEANVGYFEEHGVEVGDPVELIEVACA